MREEEAVSYSAYSTRRAGVRARERPREGGWEERGKRGRGEVFKRWSRTAQAKL